MRFLPALLFLSAPVGAQEAAGLADLIERARTHNAELRVARFENLAAQQLPPIARADLLPQIETSLSRTVDNDKNNSGGNGGGNDKNISFTVTQSLFNLPLWKRWEGDKKRVVAADARFAAAQQSLNLQVIDAWLKMHFAADTVELTEVRLQTLLEQVNRATALRQSGEGTKADVLESQAMHARAMAQLAEAKNNLSTSRADIVRLAGVAAARLQLSGAARFLPPATVDEWLMTTAKNSNNLAAAMADEQAARAVFDAALDAVFPRLEIRAQSEIGDGGINSRRDSLVLSLQQSLFTGGKLNAEKKRLSAMAAAAAARVSQIRLNEEQDARRLHGLAQTELAKIKSLEVAKTAAAAALTAVVLGYENGVRIAADVLTAEESSFDIKLQLRQAKYDYLNRLSQLHGLAGQLDENFIRSLDAFFDGETKTN